MGKKETAFPHINLTFQARGQTET